MAGTTSLRRTIDDAQVGYSAGDFFADFFTAGAYSMDKGRRGINPLTNRPFDEKDPAPTGTIHDITKTDAYQGQLARQQALAAQGTAADQQRQQALQALQALKSAPAASYTPIAVSVPSFSLGEGSW